MKIYKKIFFETWPKWTGGVILGILNIFMFLYLMPLGGIYPAMADWGIWIYRIMGLNVQPPWGSLELPHLSVISIINFGLVFGVLIGALLANEFKVKKAAVSDCMLCFLGGAIMGVGSLVAGACIIGGFYSSIMCLSLSGFYMMIGLIAGGYLGGKAMIWLERRIADKSAKTEPMNFIEKEHKSLQPRIGFLVMIILFIIASVYSLKGMKVYAGVALFGAAFGFVFQRSAFGFSTAFRDFFEPKKNDTMRGVIISFIIGVTGFTIIKAYALRPELTFVTPAGWHVILGGLIFGFGMVIADG